MGQTGEVDPIIRMRKVRKCYGGLLVLDALDLDILPSQKVAIIGASGSGKTTILRILMTLERIDSGDVLIDGEPLDSSADEKRLRRIRRSVGMVFQQFNLFPHMNVLRNLTEAPVRVLGLSKQQAEDRAVALLAKVGLPDKVNAYPAHLSGGQKQRVAIARALAMEPKIMLFDEVTSALDPELVGEVLEVLRSLARETDITMLIVTHQMQFAQDIADRVLFLDKGRVLEDDSPEVIFSSPRQPRTREFLRTVLNT